MKKLVIAGILVLLIGGYMIHSQLGTDFDDSGDRVTFAKAMGKWVKGLGKNMAMATAFMLALDWKPQVNATNSTG